MQITDLSPNVDRGNIHVEATVNGVETWGTYSPLYDTGLWTWSSSDPNISHDFLIWLELNTRTLTKLAIPGMCPNAQWSATIEQLEIDAFFYVKPNLDMLANGARSPHQQPEPS